MSDYYFDGEKIKTYRKDVTKLKKIMDSSYMESVELMNRIETEKWSGKSRDAMVAFMDLVTQFHKKFSGNEGNPIDEAVASFDELKGNLSDFYPDFREFVEMTKI